MNLINTEGKLAITSFNSFDKSTCWVLKDNEFHVYTEAMIKSWAVERTEKYGLH